MEEKTTILPADDIPLPPPPSSGPKESPNKGILPKPVPTQSASDFGNQFQQRGNSQEQGRADTSASWGNNHERGEASWGEYTQSQEYQQYGEEYAMQLKAQAMWGNSQGGGGSWESWDNVAVRNSEEGGGDDMPAPLSSRGFGRGRGGTGGARTGFDRRPWEEQGGGSQRGRGGW